MDSMGLMDRIREKSRSVFAKSKMTEDEFVNSHVIRMSADLFQNWSDVVGDVPRVTLLAKSLPIQSELFMDAEFEIQKV